VPGYFLLLFGANGLFCFIELHWIKALRLLPKPGILVQGRVRRIQRGVQAFLDLAEIPQLIAAQQEVFW
jgi:hypothetical protein